MLSRRELVKQHKSLLIMEGKCLKCRYHDLVVNSVCQLRLSQLWQQTAPGSEWLMTTKACLSLRHRFHCKSVQALFHVIFTLWLSLKEWALLWCVKGERKFCSKAALLFTCLCQSKSCGYSRIQYGGSRIEYYRSHGHIWHPHGGSNLPTERASDILNMTVIYRSFYQVLL